MKISDSANKKRIAIVAVGYNRVHSISRLLSSLNNAVFPAEDIPLVISIDCSNNQELYDFVNEFEWNHGEKYVFIQQERLGLKNHIYYCGDLTRYFKGIVLLEDDIVVSRFFYSYVVDAVNYYENDERIAQISLYKNEFNGYVGLPIAYRETGSDVFLSQDVSTWGECWTEKMWNQFKDWLGNHDENYVLSVNMPCMVKNWTRAWSKYYIAYIIDTQKYVLYPKISLSSNYGDAGEHGGGISSTLQVNLLDGPKSFSMDKFENLVKYDIYGNDSSIHEWLGLGAEKLRLDLYDYCPQKMDKEYLLTTAIYPFEVEKSFGLSYRPIELNIKYNQKGDGIFLYKIDKRRGDGLKSKMPTNQVLQYSMQGFSRRFLLKVWIGYVYDRIKEKLFRK